MKYTRATVSTLLSAFFFASTVEAAEDFDPKTEQPIIDLFRADPNSIPLEPRDPSKNLTELYVDCSKIEGREPGPVNIQSTIGGTAQLAYRPFSAPQLRFARKT